MTSQNEIFSHYNKALQSWLSNIEFTVHPSWTAAFWQDVLQHVNTDLNKCVNFCLLVFHAFFFFSCFCLPIWRFIHQILNEVWPMVLLPLFCLNRSRSVGCKVNCISCTHKETLARCLRKRLYFIFSQHSSNHLFHLATHHANTFFSKVN